jgi:hypothetical protein
LPKTPLNNYLGAEISAPRFAAFAARIAAFNRLPKSGS